MPETTKAKMMLQGSRTQATLISSQTKVRSEIGRTKISRIKTSSKMTTGKGIRMAAASRRMPTGSRSFPRSLRMSGKRGQTA